jgi:hypothetical protein
VTDLLTLTTHLQNRISANESAMTKLDRGYRIILVNITDRLKRYLDRALLGMNQPARRHETEVLLGKNMRGPAIEDLVRQSEEICGRVMERKEAA